MNLSLSCGKLAIAKLCSTFERTDNTITVPSLHLYAHKVCLPFPNMDGPAETCVLAYLMSMLYNVIATNLELMCALACGKCI